MSFDLTDDELRALIDHHEIQREKSSMMAKDHDMRCVKYQTELQGRNEESKGRKQLAEDVLAAVTYSNHEESKPPNRPTVQRGRDATRHRSVAEERDEELWRG
jgi:hypothetical protein